MCRKVRCIEQILCRQCNITTMSINVNKEHRDIFIMRQTATVPTLLLFTPIPIFVGTEGGNCTIVYVL